MKIVLAHGVLGFGEVIPGNLQAVNYFNGVKDHLEERFPGTEVFAPSVDFKGSIATRGQQLTNAIQDIGGPAPVIAPNLGGPHAPGAGADPPHEPTSGALAAPTRP